MAIQVLVLGYQVAVGDTLPAILGAQAAAAVIIAVGVAIAATTRWMFAGDMATLVLVVSLGTQQDPLALRRDLIAWGLVVYLSRAAPAAMRQIEVCVEILSAPDPEDPRSH